MPVIIYSGKTLGYKRFKDAMWKTEKLLELGVVGINKEVDVTFGTLIDKFGDIKGIPGPTPKSYKPEITANKTDEGLIELALDDRSAIIIKKILENDQQRHDELRFFLYSNILVSVWGAFETYIQMLFEELLTKKPEMLKSKETILLEDIISNKENIVNYLVERQIETIGHFKVEDLISYLKKKINFTLTPTETKNIKEVYFIRNIIAHKSGIVRMSQISKLPKGIKVKSNELEIPIAYLKKVIKLIKKVSKSIEETVEDKFYKET
ncbi:hypothetical protein D3C78_577250 [compost metagenome]